MALTPEKSIGLTEKTLERLGQDRPDLYPVCIVFLARVSTYNSSTFFVGRISLVLRTNSAAKGEVVIIQWRRTINTTKWYRSAIINNNG